VTAADVEHRQPWETDEVLAARAAQEEAERIRSHRADGHYLEERAIVYLHLVDGAWAVDAATGHDDPLEGYDDGCVWSNCQCGDDEACKVARVAADKVGLPDARELYALLGEHLGIRPAPVPGEYGDPTSDQPWPPTVLGWQVQQHQEVNADGALVWQAPELAGPLFYLDSAQACASLWARRKAYNRVRIPGGLEFDAYRSGAEPHPDFRGARVRVTYHPAG
jgi:hypothetical protein